MSVFLTMDPRRFGTFLLLTGVWAPLVSSANVFHFVDVKMNWDDALSHCRNQYSGLALVDGAENVAAFEGTPTGKYEGQAWIGLFQTTSNWTWTNNEEPTYFNWSRKEPAERDEYDSCVAVAPTGGWVSEVCNKKWGFVCSDGKDVFVSETSESWDEAKKTCESRKRALVQIHNQTINEGIKGMAHPSTVWIGLSRTRGWHWSATGERYDSLHDSSSEDDGCAAWNLETKDWSSESCSNALPFFCYSPSSRKKTTVKVTIRTNANVNDPLTITNLQHQLKAVLQQRGVTDFTLKVKPATRKPEEENATDDCKLG